MFGLGDQPLFTNCQVASVRKREAGQNQSLFSIKTIGFYHRNDVEVCSLIIGAGSFSLNR